MARAGDRDGEGDRPGDSETAPTAGVVLLVESNGIRCDLYELWLSDYWVRTASTERAALDALDGSVGVVILDQQLPDHGARRVREAVPEQAPHCHIATTNTRSPTELDSDHHLEKPVFEAELTDTVERLLRRARYTALLGRYFRLVSAVTPLEVGRKAGEVHDGAEVERAAERVEALRRGLAELRNQMDVDDVHAAIEVMRSRMNGQPTTAGRAVANKYGPDRCPNCGISWETDDDGDGQGYTSLGAFVWKCTACDDVVMQSDPSHQQLRISG